MKLKALSYFYHFFFRNFIISLYSLNILVGPHHFNRFQYIRRFSVQVSRVVTPPHSLNAYSSLLRLILGFSNKKTNDDRVLQKFNLKKKNNFNRKKEFEKKNAIKYSQVRLNVKSREKIPVAFQFDLQLCFGHTEFIHRMFID